MEELEREIRAWIRWPRRGRINRGGRGLGLRDGGAAGRPRSSVPCPRDSGRLGRRGADPVNARGRGGLAGPARRPEPDPPHVVGRHGAQPGARDRRASTTDGHPLLCATCDARVLLPGAGTRTFSSAPGSPAWWQWQSVLQPSNACCSRWVADGGQCTRKAPSSYVDEGWRPFVSGVQPAAMCACACGA